MQRKSPAKRLKKTDRKPEFNDELNRRIVEEYMKDESVEKDYDDVIAKVRDRIGLEEPKDSIEVVSEHESTLGNDTEAKRMVTDFLAETLGNTEGIELVRNTQEEGRKVARDKRADMMAISDKFDSELDRFDELESGHKFELGLPSPKLLAAGFSNLPIILRASLVSKKRKDAYHPFSEKDIKGLVKALQNPIAVFSYSKDNMRNVIVDITNNGKHFLVGVTLNFRAHGSEIEINSVSGLFPKDNHEWIKWIQDGKALAIYEKNKVQDLISSLRINPAEAERIGLNLNDVANIIQNFENPIIQDVKNNENTELMHKALDKGLDTNNSLKDSIEVTSEHREEMDRAYEDAVKRGDKDAALEMLRGKADKALNATILPDDGDVEGFKYHLGEAPKKTFKRYAVLNISPDGFKAAYAGNGQGTPVGVWLDAQNLKSYMSDMVQFDDGTFASYIKGDTGASVGTKFSAEKREELGLKGSDKMLLERGGKHSSDVPNFSQMNLKQNENGEKVSSAKDGALPHNKLIFEIEYGISENGDLTEYAKENGRMMKGKNQGLAKIGPNEYYDFKTNPNAVGNWGIGGTFRITRLVPHEEIVSKTEQYKADAIAEAERAYKAGEISKSDYEKRVKNAEAIQVQKWVGGYRPEDFGLSVESVDEMRKQGEKSKVLDITYDDNGNLIPLSERFNSEKKDIRYRTADEQPNSAEGKADSKGVVKSTAQEAITSLGGKGYVHEGYDSLNARGRAALAENPNAVGWYDNKTGEVHVYLPNCKSRYEAERTVLHEKVGHEGLRAVMGEDVYKEFCYQVWKDMPDELRGEVTNLMARKSWNMADAMDEWLGIKAESFDIKGKESIMRRAWEAIKAED